MQGEVTHFGLVSAHLNGVGAIFGIILLTGLTVRFLIDLLPRRSRITAEVAGYLLFVIAVVISGICISIVERLSFALLIALVAGWAGLFCGFGVANWLARFHRHTPPPQQGSRLRSSQK